MYVCMYVYVTLSHLRSKAQAVVHNYITYVPHLWLTKIFTPFQFQQQFTPFQQQLTITNNRISQEQLWNTINIAVIAFYFWIYNVFLGLTWYFCNHVLC